ncbi:cytosolic carboxypeptidase 2 isoform X3 [Coregonus clupeaformis]|uniref:cytosolic carboxypeptidase 2 isoform X3 n=1 Tax=Coregonus clupeaformis TaxID=59861 RepID=UPI001BDFBCD8|nr:cytosolic carboxypeptidase 2 isoform X3 [Coregonus clupeaformis]
MKFTHTFLASQDVFLIQSSTQDVPSIEDRHRDTGRENSFQGNLLRQRWRDFHHPGSLHPGTHSPDSNNSNMEDEDEEQEPGRPFTLHLGQALRTRQLVIDFDGERPIPRLREPLDLFAIPSPSTPLQGVRWPIEREVIKEAIHHIEWEPPDPEPFYQPTGHERAPMPVGEEKGNVVYCIDPGTKTSYFTCSRVGGSRGPIKSSTSCATHQDQSTLAFESRFESGNLQKAVQVGVHDYELTLRTDMYTTKHTQWFYFRVRNMKAGVTYRFTIVNLMKASSLYCLGMRPLLYSERAAWEKGEGWRRTGSNIRYYHNQHHQAEQDNNTTTNTKSLHSLTWTCQFPYNSDTCYLSHCYPYTYTHLQRYLSRLTSNSATGAYCKLRVLCRSLAGNAVHVLTVTSPGGGWMDRSAKRAVVVTARVHPGETNSSWIMQGFLDFLLGESDDARLLRETFVFKVVPMLNPDGVVVGNYRCSLSGRDLNRNYKTLLRDSFPCVWHTRNMVKRLMAERDVVLYCDFHGHSRKNNVFMYGCTNSDDATQRLHERVFPLMMSKNANDKFSFRSCKFRVQKSKEGTGRIVMWRLGIRNSYTMESTFGGSTLGNRKGTHFTTTDLKSLGYYLCDTLLDYCDPDPTKTSHCLAELRAMLRQEVRERLGREVDSDGSLSVSVSDIESSTSGSNSTESDGLPVHLLNRTDEQSQAKKKHLRSGKERNRLRQERVRNVNPKVLHRNIKNIDPVLPTEDIMKVRIQEKTVAVVREKKKREKNEYLEAVRAAYLHSHPTQPPVTEERRQYWSPQLQFGTSQAPRPGPQRRPLSVTAIQQRSFSLPVPTAKIRVHTTPIHQQPMPFSPDHRSHAGMRERMPALYTSATHSHRSPPGLEPCRSSNFYPAKSHHQWPRPEKQGNAARVSIGYYMPEAPTSNTDALEPLRRSPERDCTAGVSVSNAVPVGEQDQRGPQAAFEKPLSKPGTDGNSFLPDLRHIDFRGKSHGRLWGDQAGAGVQRQGPSKREPLRGEGRRVCGGDAAAGSVNSNHRLAQQTLQEEDKQEMGVLPQMSSTTHTKIDHPPPQLDSQRRLQKLSRAKTSRFHSSGRGAEAGTGMDLEERMVARPSGSAPPRSTAHLS